MALAQQFGRLDVDAMLAELTLSQYIEWVEYLWPDTTQTPEQMYQTMRRFADAYNRKN